ncbi:ATP-binding protein [Geobacter sp. DSM 9736]|uniref:hybrid sensor histidine kinase/response regulator n=1 Tax=Geobacter sp. DSM 9736 TaxID=1277350 RepID=UPI000B51315E|nr:ATP-binding protein [Geobacter sp. DSM 9736]SNB47270.1 GAF sensor hybrid histidine kinase [Geobacter sp. DSM 9736]
MSEDLKILLIEDSEDDARLLLREIERGGYRPVCRRVETAEEMQEALAGSAYDIVLSDYQMPQFSAPAALRILKESGLDIPFIIVSGKIGEELAAAAIKEGAHDYLMKEKLSRLIPSIERELREAHERRSRRNADNAIRAGKMEWEAVIDSVSDLIFLTSTDGTIIRCNRKSIEYFNTDYQELIGRNIGQVFYGSSAEQQNIFKVQPTAQETFEEITFPTLKGWFHVSICPMRSTTRELKGLVHVIKDITQSKKMEEEKQISDRELLTLHAVAFRLNSKIGANKIMNDLLLQLHTILQVDFASIHLLDDNFLRLKASFGLSRTFEAAIKRLPNYVPWLSQVLSGKPYKSKAADRELPANVLRTASDMGMQAWCVVPLKIGQEVMGVLMVAHKAEKAYSDREVFLLTSIASQLAVLIENHTLYDRMKEQNVELQLSRQELKDNLLRVKEANTELERLNDAKNSFIGMASHELKTPITSILGGVEFLLKYSGLQMTPEQLDIFTSVYEGVTQLKTLVDDLLSISRLEADGIILQKRSLRMIPLCREILDTFALPLSKRQLVIDITGDDTPVLADEAFSKLAIRNLLENAIKFTPDGGKVEVTASLTGRGELLSEQELLEPFYPGLGNLLDGVSLFYRLDVRDSGIGIPPEERVRVFEKFYGIGDIAYHSSGKTEFMSKGTGLGLAIVRGIMDAHHGFVWTSASRDGGSVFSLLFPADPPATDQ